MKFVVDPDTFQLAGCKVCEKLQMELISASRARRVAKMDPEPIQGKAQGVKAHLGFFGEDSGWGPDGEWALAQSGQRPTWGSRARNLPAVEGPRAPAS